MVSAANAASSGTALLGAGGRAPEPETRHVAPEVALQPAATQPGEETLLVVHLHAGQKPIAARAGRLTHPLGEALAHRGGEVEPGLVKRLDARHLTAREERQGDRGLGVDPHAAHRRDRRRPAFVHERDGLRDRLPALASPPETEPWPKGKPAPQPV